MLPTFSAILVTAIISKQVYSKTAYIKMRQDQRSWSPAHPPTPYYNYNEPQTPTPTPWYNLQPYPANTQFLPQPHYFQEQKQKLPGPPYKIQKKQSKGCGLKTLMDDINIVSLVLSTFSTFVGFGLDLILSFKGNMIAIISTVFALLFGVPAALITFLNISNPLIYLVANGLNLLSFATTFFAATSLEVGNFALLIDVLFELLGIFGLILSLFSTFPVLFEEIVDFGYVWGFGDVVKNFIEGYGCNRPQN